MVAAIRPDDYRPKNTRAAFERMAVQVTQDERFNVFERRARRYPLPAIATPEEAVKAGLKSWRNPERFGLSGYEETVTGRILPDRTCFALDLARLVRLLPEPQRTVVRLYFMEPPPFAEYGNVDVAIGAGFCGPRICERVRRDPFGRWQCDEHARSVGQLKRSAVSRIAVTLWPAYYRGQKARRGI